MNMPKDLKWYTLKVQDANYTWYDMEVIAPEHLLRICVEGLRSNSALVTVEAQSEESFCEYSIDLTTDSDSIEKPEKHEITETNIVAYDANVNPFRNIRGGNYG